MIGIASAAKAAFSLVESGISRIWPDANESEKTKLEELRTLTDAAISALEARASIILSETQGTGLKSTWRPILMLLFGLIIANNYILAPYLGALFGTSIVLEIPPDMWGLLKLGIGGYIVGRSAEKVVPVLVDRYKTTGLGGP